jgi:hypothetical protein
LKLRCCRPTPPARARPFQPRLAPDPPSCLTTSLIVRPICPCVDHKKRSTSADPALPSNLFAAYRFPLRTSTAGGHIIRDAEEPFFSLAHELTSLRGLIVELGHPLLSLPSLMTVETHVSSGKIGRRLPFGDGAQPVTWQQDLERPLCCQESRGPPGGRWRVVRPGPFSCSSPCIITHRRPAERRRRRAAAPASGSAAPSSPQ